MKRVITLLTAAALCLAQALAANQSHTIDQVNDPTEVRTAIDLHITSATPFPYDDVFIDVINTEHAVLIFDAVKPSKLLPLLGNILINGEPARNDVNCQVRLYNRGSIVYPYGKESQSATGFHPLTVYSEPSCQGDSVSAFALENSGGYMNTLSAAKLNNRIRSFRLKRGYMVTFSVRPEGRGYSRCFIADKEDLVVNSLPALLDGRISSYRVFRWYNTSKAGLANATGAAIVDALNVTSCYSFSLGETRLPDAECVPHHIYEDWPSAAACGGVNYSPHMKTNNEPGNSADDHPQTVAQILANWENLMRTGMRLCSPSSHDGSLAHLREFMDSIDARGWRCDIIDLHCYWAESSFNTWSFYDQWANRYGRPIWISEWVWGASWNSNGAFASGVTEAQNCEAIKRITANLNSWDCIERYYYWNSERDPSRIYKNNALTTTGEYYAQMNTGLGYCDYGRYIPKAPRLATVTDLAVSINTRTFKGELTWTNNNYDLTTMSILQKRNGSAWTAIDTIAATDVYDMKYEFTLEGSAAYGLHEYRIINVDYDNRRRTSNTASVFVGGTQEAGDIMFGRIEASNSDVSTINFTRQDKSPLVFTGMPSNANSTNAIVNHLSAIGRDNFKFAFDPWTAGTAMTVTRTETADFLVLHQGIHQWGDMMAIVDTCIYTNTSGSTSKMSRGDVISVTFPQPFPDNVQPVVIVQNLYTSTNKVPTSPRVFDITNTGFSMKLTKQAEQSGNIANQYTFYLAVTPGQAAIGTSGKRICAGLAEEPVGGAANVAVTFRDAAGDTLQFEAPYIVAAAQTDLLEVPAIFRKASNVTVSAAGDDGTTQSRVTGMRVRRQVDATSTIPTGQNTAARTGDLIGWVVIDTDPTYDAVLHPYSSASRLAVSVVGRRIVTSSPRAHIYNIGGTEVPSGSQLPAGLYIVSDGRESIKVLIP